MNYCVTFEYVSIPTENQCKMTVSHLYHRGEGDEANDAVVERPSPALGHFHIFAFQRLC